MPGYPMLTVDILIPYKEGITLIKRANPPYQNSYALPGGFVEYGERVTDAAVREAYEETGLEVEILKVTGVYSDPDRDPRGHVISVCYLSRPVGGELRGGSDAKEARVFELDELPELAFDHLQIIEDAMPILQSIIDEADCQN